MNRFYIFILSGIGLCLAIATPGHTAQNTQVYLAGRVFESDGFVFGRSTSIQYAFDNDLAIRLLNESYDGFLYGHNIRWGVQALAPILTGNLSARAGAGMSINQGETLDKQLSADLYGQLSYWILFLELDNLFFNDGFFTTTTLGIDSNLLPGVSLRLGIGGIYSSWGSRSRLFPNASLGLRCSF